MVVNQIIGIMLPSIAGMHMYREIYGESKSIFKKIEIYLLLVLFTNLFSYSFVVYVQKNKGFEFTNQFTIKYIILSLFFSIILPIITKFWQDRIKLNVVVKKNEK